MIRRVPALVLALLAAFALSTGSPAQTSFITFETGPVRPMALTPDGSTLLVTNIPDNHIEVFDVLGSGIRHRASIPVGMEPCAVAARTNDEVWVVNHLSDSVSVVDLSLNRVVRTLLVGDEPRDIVFAQGRAFVTTAHRGQHRTDTSLNPVTNLGSDDGDPELTTPSVPRADVWVFDGANPGAEVGGVPVGVVELFTDTPRALAVSADGTHVFAAGFHTGNQTAVVSEGMVCDGFGTSNCSGDGVTSPNGLGGGQLPGGNPGPSTNHQFVTAPETGLIVKYDNAQNRWEDENGENWDNGIRFHLPDKDVFRINASTLAVANEYQHAGTILFNMAVNPISGNVYVSNGDAQNLTRFEGAGTFGGTTVQGNLAQYGVTVISQPGGTVTPRHLNSHINYATLPAPGGTKNHSLATPVDMAVSSNGATLYVAAFGSSKIGVIPTAALEAGTFDPTVESANYLSVSGGGPAGLALDEANNRLYVLTRFDNSVSVFDLGSSSEVNHIPLHNPEPADVVTGRPHLYDAFATSSNGEASCSSCHIFGDMDSLSWDLGDPDGDVTQNFQTINLSFGAGGSVNGGADVDEFHPMKGPMTTQTLRGMVNSGHMHWRGDRVSGFCGDDTGNTNDSELSFKNFLVAFSGLVGDSTPPLLADCNGFMQEFTDFALALTLPPNPVRNLDNSLTTAQQNGADFYDGPRLSDGVSFLPGLGFTCEGCHTLNASNGHFGTGGEASFENEPQIVKIPHLRNMYQKVGMFGMPNVSFNVAGDNSHQGDQVRGTGFLHDGSTDTLFRFFLATVFDGQTDPNTGFQNNGQREDMEQFMLAFDTDLAPIVGQQVTLTSTNSADVLGRIGTLETRADSNFTSEILGGTVKECDLVVKGLVDGEKHGWLFDPGANVYLPDETGEPNLSPTALRALANDPAQELTYTCVPPGSGTRMGIDRDLDGALDGDEEQARTEADNPGSLPGACNNGIDDDGDGDIDLADSGCLNLLGTIENPACSNGYDDDNDGLVDAADPQCAGTPHRNRENPKACGLLGIEPLALLLLRRRRTPRA